MATSSFTHTCTKCDTEQEIEYEADGYKVLGVCGDEATVCTNCRAALVDVDVAAQQAHKESLIDQADAWADMERDA